MASLARTQLSSLVRSALAPTVSRCCCVPSYTSAVSRRFLATTIDTIDLPTPKASTSAATVSPPLQDIQDGTVADKTSVSSLNEAGPFVPVEYESRRAPLPIPAERANEAQQIYLPNIIIRLVRNSPREKHNPFIATFRVPVQLTKPDIVSYLWQVYGLKVTSISTIVEMGQRTRASPGSFKSMSRKKATKKAIVGMEEPFWFPEPRPSKWLNDNFEKDSRKDSLVRKLMPVGDGGPGRARRSWRWRGANASKQGVGARYSEIVKRLQERQIRQEDQVSRLVEKEKVDMRKKLEAMNLSQ